jgi:N utilization substance protein B
MIGARRKARIAALQALYESDCSHHDVKNILNRAQEDKSIPEDILEFAEDLIKGISDNKDRIDSVLHHLAPLFPLTQIAAIDRNILRIAAHEILFNSEVPPKAVINEAVELAKTFGSDTSPKFINGVLGSLISNQDTIRKDFCIPTDLKIVPQLES